MKFLILIFILFMGGCGFGPIRGSGKIKTTKIDTEPFTKIHMDQDFHLIIQQGGRYVMEITADHNIISSVSESVSNRVLNLTTSREIIPKTPVRIRLIAPEIEEVIHTGNENIHLKLLDAKIIVVTAKSNGSITAEGKLNHLILNLEGNGSIDLTELDFGYAEITAIGSSTISISSKNKVGFRNYGQASIQTMDSPKLEDTCMDKNAIPNNDLIKCL